VKLPRATRLYLKIDGHMVYLGRAVDAEGEVLDVFVQSKRDKRDALKLMRKLLGRGDDLRNGDSQEGANRIQR
jgi:putative transposase